MVFTQCLNGQRRRRLCFLRFRLQWKGKAMDVLLEKYVDIVKTLWEIIAIALEKKPAEEPQIVKLASNVQEHTDRLLPPPWKMTICILSGMYMK